MGGTILSNRYEILEKIGEGGMSIVYKAKDHRLGRMVAVKVLKQEFASDKEFVEKFKSEATSAASLSNNNIVNIYDVGSDEDTNFIVMEYIQGKTLKDVIKAQGRIEWRDAINIALHIAKALQCAHQNGIVHRDIKPQNVLVSENGIIKVTDFGIARASNSATITNSNKVLGSAHYFSPEQAMGNYVDCRSDIYSLGIVIYEMVTGKVPYDAESPVSVALKHIQEPVVPPKKLNFNIPQSLNDLILKAIEKEPIKRYQKIEEMILDLERVKENVFCAIKKNDVDDDETRIMDPVAFQGASKNKPLTSDPESKKNDESDEDEDESDEDNNEDGNEDDNEEDEDVEESPKNKKKMSRKTKNIIILASTAVLVVVLGTVLAFMVFGNKTPSANNVKIPNILKMNKDDAKAALEKVGLVYEEGGTDNSDQPKDTIISCNPNVGTEVKSGSSVRVIVSAGTEKSQIPYVVNMDLASAKQAITQSGFKVGNVTEAYSDSASGIVIKQTPDSGTQADPNTAIDLVVSKGPQQVTQIVPDLTNLSLDQARSKLAALKLKIATTPDAAPAPSNNLTGAVHSQDIKAGTSVQEGTTITVGLYTTP